MTSLQYNNGSLSFNLLPKSKWVSPRNTTITDYGPGSAVAQWLRAWLETVGLRVQASPEAQLQCCPWAKHIYPSVVLVQPRDTCPCLTERLLMGRKESNQTNKQTNRRHCESETQNTNMTAGIQLRKATSSLFLWHQDDCKTKTLCNSAVKNIFLLLKSLTLLKHTLAKRISCKVIHHKKGSEESVHPEMGNELFQT